MDFTAAPSRRKPVVAAFGTLVRGRLCIDAIERCTDFGAFERLLARDGPWHGGFDFPFGQPRAFVAAAGWPTRWPALVRHLSARPRAEFEQAVYAFMRARPAGRKLLHRAADGPAGSSSPMQLQYVPVGKMFFEGAPRLARAGVTLPRMRCGDPARVAVEAYPALVARKVLGRESYKNDRPAAPRTAARRRLVEALRDGALKPHYGMKVELHREDAITLEHAADADALDAVLAAVQAAWSATMPRFGLPARFDTLEGWIADPETLARPAPDRAEGRSPAEGAR